MILVDSSVWIDYLDGKPTPETDKLDMLLQLCLVGIGDLMLVEVLQGIGHDYEYERVKRLLTSLDIVELGDEAIAIQAAQNYRKLRKLGFTIRKTIDTIIATRCIEDDYELLHSDSDFNPFSMHLGLQSVT